MEEKRKYLELFDGAFDSTVAEKIKPENKPYVAYSRTEGVAYTIIPKEEGTMYTVYKVVSKDISNCTYNMVDLGLSVKWADRNVGATNSEHYGSYFQWGDTDAYTYDGAGEVTAAELAEILNPLLSPQLGMEITADNVGMVLEQMGITDTDLINTPVPGFSLDKLFNWDSYNEIDQIISYDEYGAPNEFKKYSQGKLIILEPIDDAATFHMGSQYRMPTKDEIQELINNTIQTFIDLDGNEYIKGTDAINIERGKLKGVRFIGSNGNSIFIPAAGGCDMSGLIEFGVNCNLWSSSLDSAIDSDGANYLEFDNAGEVYHHHALSRSRGSSIRGVQA